MKKLLFALLVLGQMSYAQKNKTVADSTKTNQLEEVYVTANRTATKRSQTPVAISKLNAKAIDETKSDCYV